MRVAAEGCSLAHRAVHQGNWESVSKILHVYFDEHFLLLQNKTKNSKTTENSINHLLAFLSIISQVFGAGYDPVTNNSAPVSKLAAKNTSLQKTYESLLMYCNFLRVSRLLPVISLKIVDLARCEEAATNVI